MVWGLPFETVCPCKLTSIQQNGKPVPRLSVYYSVSNNRAHPKRYRFFIMMSINYGKNRIWRALRKRRKKPNRYHIDIEIVIIQIIFVLTKPLRYLIDNSVTGLKT
jgi:hypothetical protein